MLVQYLEDRNGKALVRLPNGSKTSVDYVDLRSRLVRFVADDARCAVDGIGPGDLYEDCGFHPVLCIYRDGDEVGGISLIDGSQPRACSIARCGVRKLTIADVAAPRNRLPEQE